MNGPQVNYWGILDLLAINPQEDLVRCNNCMSYYYSEDGGGNNPSFLALLLDESGVDVEWYYGCPKCNTDSYLMDIVLAEFSLTKIREMQAEQANSHHRYRRKSFPRMNCCQ